MEPTKADLLVALADNDAQITKAVALRSGQLGDEEWQANLDLIIALRGAHRELENKLIALRK